MLKQLQMGLRAFLLLASRVWTCVCFLLKKQVRAVSNYNCSLVGKQQNLLHSGLTF
jgi:hypothetical protein